MMKLNDGRGELWQWDTNRKLTVDVDCSQVHFSNKVFGRSINMDVVDGVAIIPDILLQTDKELTAWAFVGTPENGYTKISKTFKVNRRNKPADYVFTPHEQTTLAEIMERLDDLEEFRDSDAIKNAIKDYLEQNPVEAPVQSVNEKTGNVKLSAQDVGAISQDDLQEATNKALEQAKESGDFDGEPGAPGSDANVTAENIEAALGYTPASEDDIPTIPTALKNPNALTFTGAATGSYDGSAAKTVNIPSVPSSLKNPYPLTINGTEYDGSEAVELNIEGGGSTIHVGNEPPDDPDATFYIDTDEDPDESSGSGIDVTAEVGQTIVVEAVDESGKPTKWKAVDFPEAAQSDWNAADGEPGHVLNRPFYQTGTETKTLYDNTVTISNNMYGTAGFISLLEGKTYTVIWDGTSYECQCFAAVYYGENTACIGNPGFLGGENNGLPFAVGCAPSLGMVAVASMIDGEHTVKVTEEIPIYKPIDAEALPSTLKTKVFVFPAGSFGEVSTGDHVVELADDYASEFANHLWYGGDLILDMNLVFPKITGANTLGMYRKKVIDWEYAWTEGIGRFSLIVPMPWYNGGQSGDESNLKLEYMEIRFESTWTPPAG